MTLFYGSDRRPVRLGPELARGGEGRIHTVSDRHDAVAKLYLARPDSAKVEKLQVMATSAYSELARIAAWPFDLLVDGSGNAAGFVMPRIAARQDAHELYSPKSRAQSFPEADFRFIVHVAANVARAFGAIHQKGIVVGDINHGNLMVGADGTVVLIDCDSFQVTAGTRTFTCDVGVPLFTAPELQGKPFRGLLRTANHDHFGLGVLLFHLLFMGRHPFAGRYLARGDMPIEQAIAEHRFAYGQDRATLMERPPGTVPLSAMGHTVAQLFARAFSRAGAAEDRPEPREWVKALSELHAGLKTCSRTSWHHHHGGLATCPWCDVEASTGVRLFGQKIDWPSLSGVVDVATLWNAISSVPRPPPAPPLPSVKGWAPPPDLVLPSFRARKLRRTTGSVLYAIAVLAGLVALVAAGPGAGALTAALIAGLAWAVNPNADWPEKREANARLNAARQRWLDAASHWERAASVAPFDEKLKDLAAARDGLKGLPAELQKATDRLRSQLRERQLSRYLDRFRIDRASISGIGPSRSAMLASYGIETAADIVPSRVMQVPGFKRARTNDLMAWRKSHEVNFRFNPAEPMDPQDLARVTRDFEQRKQKLVQRLQAGPMELGRLAQEARSARGRLFPQLVSLWNEFQLAQATHAAYDR